MLTVSGVKRKEAEMRRSEKTRSKKRNRGVGALLTLVLLLSNLGFAQQYQLKKGENIRIYSGEADDDGGILDVLTYLPAGTVIDVSEADYRKPGVYYYTCDSSSRQPCDPDDLMLGDRGFVEHVKIVS